LLPLITRELRHIVKNKAIKREVDAAKHRSVCGTSNTSFNGYAELLVYLWPRAGD
jgi:lysine-specific demethylase 3